MELLTCSKHGLHLLHTLALTLPPVLLEAHGLQELEIDRKARRRDRADMALDRTWVSALYTNGNNTRKHETNKKRHVS